MISAIAYHFLRCRRLSLVCGLGCALLLPALSAAELRVLLAGQALIKHDLRTELPDRFAAIASLVREGSPYVAFTDLETTIQGAFGGKPTRDTEFFHATAPAALDCLKQIGFNLLATGNNHSWDLGPEGVLSTLAEVDARGLARAGSGRNLGEAAAPVFLETPAGRVALVAFASGKLRNSGATAMRPGVNEVRLDAEQRIVAEDWARVQAAIRLAAAHAACVIVYQHDHYWEEDRSKTPEWKVQLARDCIDAGGSVFVSHGVPQLHGIELYRGRPIFYGLGSFIFHTITKPGHYAPEVWQSVLADLTFADGRLRAIRLRPVVLNETGHDPSRFNQTRGAPETAAGEAARQVLARLAAQSRPFGTELIIEGDTALVRLSQ
jgi:poly-gamma-glutamate capsule biosynthesis protein CapA/YwtB (metallophosphatase superfamily)